MSRAGFESLKLRTLSATWNPPNDGDAFPTEVVIGMKRPGWAPTHFSPIATGWDKVLATTRRIELPGEKASRLATVFSQLIVPKEAAIDYNCLSLVNFVEGFKNTLEADQVQYARLHEEATSPYNLEAGASYIMKGEKLSDSPDCVEVHAVLATSSADVIHIGGPNRPLYYGSAAQLSAIWSGDLRKVIGSL